MKPLYLLIAALVLVIGLPAAWVAMTMWVETPDYRSVSTDGAFELRDYPPLRAAEVVRPGSRDAAVRAGFGPLAGYIFARERPGEKIAMTAPVTQSPDQAGGWRVRFLMPKGYALSDLPQPASADLTLLEIPGRRMAATRFSGSWSDARFAQKTAELEAWMAEQGLEAAGAPVYAYYNDPFTPGFLRRNEVLIEVAQAQ